MIHTTARILRAGAFAASALILTPLPVQAAPASAGTGYYAETYLQHTSADPIISYDWGADGHLYYSTDGGGYSFGGIYRYTGAGNPTNVVPGDPTLFVGTSLLSVGDYLYHNPNDLAFNQYIYNYGPISGAPSSEQISGSNSYSLHTNSGRLFISGAGPSWQAEIYYSGLEADGSLSSDPAISLGEIGGSSGPITFDGAGNMYYATGFGGLEIFRWSAAEVAAAIADPLANPLSPTGSLWLDYSALYPGYAGGTSLLFTPEGELWLTITGFSGDSVLASFGVDDLGAYDGFSLALLEDSGRLGDLRLWEGGIYVSSGNGIYHIIPEPGAGLLALLGVTLLRINPRGRGRGRGAL